MTMYASQAINTDPKPFVDADGHRYWADWDPEWVYLPRTEYDNNPNPILVEFRLSWYPGKARHFLNYLDGDVYDWRSYSEEVKDHARKVLTRLAALGGEE